MITTEPFWTDKFGMVERELLDSLGRAHAVCALRGNPSSLVIAQSAVGSRDLSKAIAAALMTLGDLHAPVEQCYLFLASDRLPATDLKLPGWGNSFVRGEPDPAFEPVDQLLRILAPSIHQRIVEVTDWLHDQGKKIYPNPGCYTAAVALAVGLPARAASYLFIAARLESWTRAFLDSTAEEPSFA